MKTEYIRPGSNSALRVEVLSGASCFSPRATLGCGRCLRWLALFGLVALKALGATYYIDFAGGLDSNNGTSTNTPWKRCPQMVGFSGSYAHSTGDRFIFKGGVTWPAAALPVKIVYNGVTNNLDYYGVDTNYFTGSSWARPIFNEGGGTGAGIDLSSQPLSFITFDNIEFYNFNSAGASCITLYNSCYINVLNCYFHGWANGASDSLWCIYGNGYMQFSNQISGVISNCVFDGSPNGNSGGSVFMCSGYIVNCISTNMSNGYLPVGNNWIYGCRIGPINPSFDPSQHENAIESDGIGNSYWHNNVIHDIVGMTLSLQWGSSYYVWNNVIWNSGPIPVQTEATAAPVYLYNNTIYNNANEVCRAVNPPGGNLVAWNNHFIGSGGLCTPAEWASVSQLNNLTETAAVAASYGYSINNLYAPTSGNSPTVGGGTNLTFLGLFSNDLLGTARPASGPWDIGAYEYSAGSGTNPVISVSANTLNFSPIQVGSSQNLTVSVQNVGSGTLAGAATVAAPFSIVSGGAYTLGQGQSQTVTIGYSPTVGGSASQTINFSGGGGARVSVTASAWAVLPGLSFGSYAGTISAPFVVSSNYISQSAQTGVANGGVAVYGFIITNAGQYTVSAMVNCPDGSANSFYLNIDAQPSDPTMIWDVPITSGFANEVVSWRGTGTDTNNQFVPQVFSLSAGTHELIIIGREANAQLGQITIAPYSGPTGNPPSITSQPVGMTNSTSGGFTLAIVATGAAPLAYQWQFGGANLSGAVASSYSQIPAMTSQSGNYLCLISNAYGAVTSSTVNVLITNAVAGSGANWYVDNTATGANDGTSWANAWTNFANVIWGPGGVKAGDTLFISGGSVSQTYTAIGDSMLNVGAAGTSTSPITVQVGQDSGHNGLVLFNANGYLHPINIGSGMDYVTVDGRYNGAIHLFITNCSQASFDNSPNADNCGVDVSYANYPRILGVDISTPAIGIHGIYGTGGEFAYCNLHDIREESGIRLVLRNGQFSTNYDMTFVHNNTIQVNKLNTSSGIGADGITGCSGLTVCSNVIYGLAGTLISQYQHQDLIQMGCHFMKVYANDFYNGADSGCIDQDNNNAGYAYGGDLYFYNNTVRVTDGSGGLYFFRIYTGSGTLSSISNCYIDNNTFIDSALRSAYGPAVGFFNGSGSAVFSNCHLRNNIFYNCGSAVNSYNCVVLGGFVTNGMDADYNLVNAGANGSVGFPFQQVHSQSTAPAFVYYSPGSTSNDLHLSGSDTAARDKAETLSYFSVDKDFVSRPQGSAWDIGAYEYVTGGSARLIPPPVPKDLHIVSVR